jgi:hypothetical protein
MDADNLRALIATDPHRPTQTKLNIVTFNLTNFLSANMADKK